MINLLYLRRKWHERNAQVLLPAVLLAPIFVLVVYLLFETAKVSVAKIRNQFALDNAAYSQVSSTSTYLNAVAMVNGPLPYRVMQSVLADRDSSHILQPKDSKPNLPPIDVFDVFYKGGGVPSIGPEYENEAGLNKPPTAESNDWGVRYYDKVGEHVGDDKFSRSGWNKENPQKLPEPLPITSKKLVEDYKFAFTDGADTKDSVVMMALQFYLETYIYVGAIYKSQDYAYKQLSKNELMFREGYYLNVSNCKRSECARQSAAQLRKFLDIQTKPMDIGKFVFHYGFSSRMGSYHGGDEMELNSETLIQERLFQFAYLEQSSRSKLKTLGRGVLLKQPFSLPRNIFNINLEQKYKPYVRNRVKLTCPRGSNNCVWPNPLPKYNVRLEP